MKKKNAYHSESYLEYVGAFQSSVQKERSTKNVPGHKVANTLQDGEPCVDSEENCTVERVPEVP